MVFIFKFTNMNDVNKIMVFILIAKNVIIKTKVQLVLPHVFVNQYLSVNQFEIECLYHICSNMLFTYISRSMTQHNLAKNMLLV